MSHPVRLIVVSNRLPVSLCKEGECWHVETGKGGLITALAPVLRNRGGDWIGWTGAGADVDLRAQLKGYSRQEGYSLHGVNLTEEEVHDFYHGFSNEVIWPLFHDFPSACNFHQAYFDAYLAVNRKFAQVVVGRSEEDDYVWVHDYHLMHLAQKIRKLGGERRTGFFLHIPFPSQDIFLKLPWRRQMLEALLEYDLIGFQTFRDRRNFIRCMSILFKDWRQYGRGPVVHLSNGIRTIKVGYFPISIDFREFSTLARTRESAELAERVASAFRRRTLVLGADRLDYTKGIPQRLLAFRALLKKYPQLRTKISLVQIVVPSRERVPEYQAMKHRIEGLVSEINGEYSEPGWVPVYYLYRSLSRDELIGYYRAASIAFVTPLRDGMNLVAKEFCACNVDGDGVVILSEFAGAAAQFQRGALLVNPYDVEGVADALYAACQMPPAERRRRMQKLKTTVRKYDIYWWVNSFLGAAFGKKLEDFPAQESVDYGLKE